MLVDFVGNRICKPDPPFAETRVYDKKICAPKRTIVSDDSAVAKSRVSQMWNVIGTPVPSFVSTLLEL